MSEILTKKEKGIFWITLNRPESKNAFSDQMIVDLCNSLETAQADDEIKVIVLTGAGNCFCAGGDLKAMDERTGMFAGESFELKSRYERGIQQIPLTMESLNKITVAMVNGPAIGAGCDLTAMCDFRLASDQARFGVTFAALGLVSGDGGPYFMNRIIGYSKTLEMYLSAKVYGAKEAEEMGLVNQVCSESDLKKETMKFCEQFTKHSLEALSMAKDSIKFSHRHDLPSSLALLSSYQGIAQRTEFHHSQVRKFLKKN
jgi:enoyl-CoA hydratase/carnithine racemase